VARFYSNENFRIHSAEYSKNRGNWSSGAPKGRDKTAQGANPGLLGTNQIPLVFRDPMAQYVIPFHIMEWNHVLGPGVFLATFYPGFAPWAILSRAFSPKSKPVSMVTAFG